MDLAVRADVDPLSLVSPIRRTVTSLSPQVPVTNVRTLAQLVRDDVASPRFQTLVLAMFAALALSMAAVGIAGVMAFSVTQRNREIGVRMALGAGAASVARMVLADGLKLTAAGLCIGLLGALAGARLLDRLLYDTAPTDPLVFVAAPITLAIVAVVAALLPAGRAARIEPVVVMKG
jgi:ABC-type antimicrobial peptide transport system permease subunit